MIAGIASDSMTYWRWLMWHWRGSDWLIVTKQMTAWLIDNFVAQIWLCDSLMVTKYQSVADLCPDRAVSCVKSVKMKYLTTGLIWILHSFRHSVCDFLLCTDCLGQVSGIKVPSSTWAESQDNERTWIHDVFWCQGSFLISTPLYRQSYLTVANASLVVHVSGGGGWACNFWFIQRIGGCSC